MQATFWYVIMADVHMCQVQLSNRPIKPAALTTTTC